MSISVELDPAPWVAVFDRFPFPAVVVERGTTRLLRANRAAVELLRLDGDPIASDEGPSLADLVTRPLAGLDEDLRITAGGGDLPLVLRSRPGDRHDDDDASRRYGCQVVPVTFGDGPIDRWLVTFGCNLARLNRVTSLSRDLRLANDEAMLERQRRSRLGDELRTLERFAQAMAHDLKGPLRHIGALLPAIEDSIGTELPPDARRLMELARRSAEQGSDLVDALLTHATAVSGDVELAPVDLDRVVEASVRDHRWMLEGVPHRMSVVAPIGIVQADRTLMRLLVDNLLGNAIKYREPGRTLEIEISGGSRDPSTILEIRDNGIGFDAEDGTRIFEPFIRLVGSIGGHGIGLATCQTICHRHGWTIAAVASPGRGASFQIRGHRQTRMP